MNLTDRVAKLLGEQPWPGYDDQDVGAIATKLDHADADMAAARSSATSAITRTAPTSSMPPSAASTGRRS